MLPVERHQLVQSGGSAGLRCALSRPSEANHIEAGTDVQNIGSDRDSNSGSVARISTPKHAEGKILDGKVSNAPRRFHPGGARRVVSFVHARCALEPRRRDPSSHGLVR